MVSELSKKIIYAVHRAEERRFVSFGVVINFSYPENIRIIKWEY